MRDIACLLVVGDIYLVGDLKANPQNCTDEQALGNRQDHISLLLETFGHTIFSIAALLSAKDLVVPLTHLYTW